MWRDETDFLDMFMTYYNSQFEVQESSSKKKYRDFLMEIIAAHEQCKTYDDVRLRFLNVATSPRWLALDFLQVEI